MTSFLLLFFFNDTATTEIYTLSLHDALPICLSPALSEPGGVENHVALTAAIAELQALRYTPAGLPALELRLEHASRDRKSTRLNSSHQIISYAVFCLKKKNNN